jgi:spermidine synthase
VIPWLQLDTAKVPGGEGELRLMQRGAEFSIVLGNIELMNSRLSGSEEALAVMTCERLRDRRSARVLIGGLGMGFTLRAALGQLGPDARVDVAELVPAVGAWARNQLAGIFGGSLADSRVTLWEGDVGRLIATRPATYDAILLDVDNGPTGFTREANDGLYDASGLGAARAALRPGGILAVWSTGPDRKFTERLRRTGFRVDELAVRANGARGGARHVIWMATKAEAPRQQPGARRGA